MTRFLSLALLAALALLPAGCALGPESSLFDAMQAAQTGKAPPPKVTASTTPAPRREAEVKATISHLKNLSENRQRKQESRMQSSVEELLLLRQKQSGDLSDVPPIESSSQN